MGIFIVRKYDSSNLNYVTEKKYFVLYIVRTIINLANASIMIMGSKIVGKKQQTNKSLELMAGPQGKFYTATYEQYFRG